MLFYAGESRWWSSRTYQEGVISATVQLWLVTSVQRLTNYDFTIHNKSKMKTIIKYIKIIVIDKTNEIKIKITQDGYIHWIVSTNNN